MRVPVRFDHTNVKRYYDEFSRQSNKAAHGHQFSQKAQLFGILEIQRISESRRNSVSPKISEKLRFSQDNCLRDPLSQADMYLQFLIDDEKIQKDPVYRVAVTQAKIAIFDAKLSIRYMQCNFPPEMNLCNQYVDAFHRFVDDLPDSLDFESGKPFLRESDNSVHIANAMFSPEPAGAEVLLGLQEYHQGRHPVIFRMRDAHQQPSFSNDGCDTRKPPVILMV